MGKKIEMIGKRFGRWTVIAEADRYKNGCIKWLCRCDCGNEKAVNGSILRSGGSTSCGCYNHEVITKDNPDYKTKLYGVYGSMKQRTVNPNDRSYHNYGGRGIKVCDEWLGKDGFQNFKKWAYENGYKEGLWLDRVDNDGNYEPSNCKWATPKDQQNNKRTNTLVEIDGVVKNIQQWAEVAGISRATMERRVELGWTGKDLLKPIDKSRSHPEEIRRAIHGNGG